ncbi:MAG: T9SS type A sorting domain-containing protein [Saprospiraceae bacterium]
MVFSSLTGLATTIVPFENLGEMALNAEAVVYVHNHQNFEALQGDLTRFRSQLEILESIKGPLQQGHIIEIQNLHKKNSEVESIVWGDLELLEGNNYLLFLSKNDFGDWKPMFLSYGAFEEHFRNNKSVLVPFDLGAEVFVHKTAQGKNAEPLLVYSKNDLFQHLKNILKEGKKWNQDLVKTEHSIHSFELKNRGTPPSHCTYLSGSAPYPRWNSFPTALPVFYTSGGDPSCASVIGKIQNAISLINTNYDGINITDGGTHTFTPDCSSGANGSQFTSYVASNYGTRSITIQFNDPCSEIPNLSGCSGTLAIGGLYWFSSTHMWDGMPWNNAGYGYVVVNNGVGACLCSSGSSYDLMMTHEMTHALGFGHINTSNGAANMNPSCCVGIQSLDIECLDYTYLSPTLPVELISFDASQNDSEVQVTWSTANELNNDYFEVERAVEDSVWETIGMVQGKGSTQSLLYQFIDLKPEQEKIIIVSVKQVDFDGRFEHSDQVFVGFYQGIEARIYPNPLQQEQANLSITTENAVPVEIEIVNANGLMVQQSTQETNRGQNLFQIQTSGWAPGIYFIKMKFPGQQVTQRLMKQ